MILYTENPKDSTRKLLELFNEFSKVAGYKIDVQKSITLLYINSGRWEREISERQAGWSCERGHRSPEEVGEWTEVCHPLLIYHESSDTLSVFELLYGPASVFWNTQEHEGLIKWPHVSHNGLGRPSSSPVNYASTSMEVGGRHQQRRRAVWRENGDFHCIRETSRPPWPWMYLTWKLDLPQCHHHLYAGELIDRMGGPQATGV